MTWFRILVVLGCVLAATQLPTVTVTMAADDRPGGSAKADDATANDQQGLRQQLFHLIVSEYLGHGRENHRDRPELFAPQVRYYKRGIISREQLLADKAAYYKRWPQRRYTLIDGSIEVRPGENDTIDFRFRYTFEVSDSRETRRGIGVARLGVGLIDDTFTIVSEDGEVERRL